MTNWGNVTYFNPTVLLPPLYVSAFYQNPRGEVIYQYLTWVPHTGATGQPSMTAVAQQATPGAGPPMVT
jgi:hypothetical protein